MYLASRCQAMRYHLLLALVLLFGSVKAQDPHFTQAYSNPLYLNPAFAGFDGAPRLATSYRLQWPVLNGRYHTVNVSYDQMIDSTHGIGINYQFDMAGGTIETHGLTIMYAPAIRLFKGKLVVSPAAELGWRGKYLHADQLTYGNMIDPRYPFVYSVDTVSLNNTQRHVFDLNGGLIISFAGLTAGASFHHITQPNEGFYGKSKLPIKYTAHISYVWDFHPSFSLSPSFIFQKQQDFYQLHPAINFLWSKGLLFGVAFRTSLTNPDAVSFMLGYQGNGIRSGYSYDFTVSTLGNSNTGGSHELTFSYLIDSKGASRFKKGIRRIAF